MATRGRGRRKKKASKESADQEGERLLCDEESGDNEGPQLKEAEEIIERLHRKYRYKLQEVQRSEDFISSPSKKREEENVLPPPEDKLTNSTVTSPRSNETSINKENLMTPLPGKRSVRVQERYVSKQTPQVVHITPPLSTSLNPSLSTSLDPSLSTPENQSTPCISKEKKRYSHFGFSKLDSPDIIGSLPPTPPTVDSYDFPSQSQSSTDTVNKKVIKALSFDIPVPGGIKKRQTRKTKKKKEKQTKEMEEWLEAINKEFEEIDNYELVID